MIQQRAVGFRELIRHQLIGGHPAQIGHFDLLRLARENPGLEKIEAHIPVRVGVDDTVNFRPNLETKEICFADPRSPPGECTPATRKRLAELTGAGRSLYW